MPTIEIIHNPRCSKSRAALELLNKKGLSPEVTEYMKNPLSAAQLEQISHKLGLKPSQFVRQGEYSKLGIEIAGSEEGILKQMVEYPILIERPIVIKGDKARLGRPTESILEII
ncbi:arsenate reductase (glutaredoxin) [Oceanispirochaeta crateris]|uniref:Arsenate reductase (Glutaredoxin) n=1 Tax=Oceanispirochaeta crateris TaxID=2518645 RepID=A0A5C1QGT4_9SPIO|nr:arsenate reductase (glutaredoxin) [Oceanispirochaeta crateris]QEN07323.1 arsenate reductase (glutaredoxin) [Oceanispirochaeta crateris]